MKGQIFTLIQVFKNDHYCLKSSIKLLANYQLFILLPFLPLIVYMYTFFHIYLFIYFANYIYTFDIVLYKIFNMIMSLTFTNDFL